MLNTTSRNRVLDALFGAGVPATFHLGLLLFDPNADDDTIAGGTSLEPVGMGYARMAVTNNATNFPAAVNGLQLLNAEVTWPNPTGNWGMVRFVGLYSAATAGELLAWAQLPSPRNVTIGRAPFIMPGTVTFVYTGS